MKFQEKENETNMSHLIREGAGLLPETSSSIQPLVFNICFTKKFSLLTHSSEYFFIMLRVYIMLVMLRACFRIPPLLGKYIL